MNNETNQSNQNQIQTNTDTENQSAETNTNETSTHHKSMNLAIVGGVVGAGAGLLAKPEVGKKIIQTIGKSELIKVASQEFGKTAQELLAGQAQESFKQMASGYLDKMSQSIGNLGSHHNQNSSDHSQAEDSAKYEEIKQENKDLNERLQRIEEMLGDLAASDK